MRVMTAGNARRTLEASVSETASRRTADEIRPRRNGRPSGALSMSCRPAPGRVILMTEPEPPRIGDDTTIGPDADPGGKGTRLADGARLTGTVAGMIVDQIRQTARLLPRPDLGGPRRPDLMPLPE